MDFTVIHIIGFNTQPPEGGWYRLNRTSSALRCFNTQPPEGGWLLPLDLHFRVMPFQHTAA